MKTVYGGRSEMCYVLSRDVRPEVVRDSHGRVQLSGRMPSMAREGEEDPGRARTQHVTVG